MKKYKVYHSSRFDRELSKLDKYFKDQIDKTENKLIEKPYVGKPLNIKWFRGKKTEKLRIYYLIYEDLESIIMTAISEKKDQQKVINTIRLLFDFFREELEKLMKEE